MLTGLRLENIALIERLELTFGRGFTVLTGETGAGKSILLDAFALDPTLRDRVRAVPHLFDALPDAERARLFGT